MFIIFCCERSMPVCGVMRCVAIMLIISTTGGQFTPSPEMYKYHNIVYPEYLEANSHDEIVKAVRENLLFGA